MNKNRKIQIMGAVVLMIAAALVTLSAINAPAPARVDLSWPPRPDYSFLAKSHDAPSASSDYYQRHMNERLLNIPDTTDYSLRHPELNAVTGTTVDTSDYALRHPQLQSVVRPVDLTDYFFRLSAR